MSHPPVSSETHRTFCRICEALCGLDVTVEGGRVTEIRPDDAHVATRGFGCVKGLKQHKLLDSPDRLLHPLKRVGDRHERISWEQALGEIGAKVQAITARLSPDSIAMYVGTAAGFSVLHPVFAQGFMTGLGSKSMYASATQDCANKFAVARHVYGFPFTQPFPDLDAVECLVIVGANPVVSKWSFLQVSNPGQRLKEIEARGGRVVVVDPAAQARAQGARSQARRARRRHRGSLIVSLSRKAGEGAGKSRLQADFAGVVGQQRLEDRNGLGRADVVALGILDADVGQPGQYLGGVDPLGHGADAHALADLRDRLDHAAVDVVARDVVHELPVDLQEIDRQVLQEDERRQAAAEIVEREQAAAIAQLADEMRCGCEAG